MTNDDIRRVIDQLQRKYDEKRDESNAHPCEPRGNVAHGMACGLAYAIGALVACIKTD